MPDVTQELYRRIGEGSPQPRLEPMRRITALLGDPQSASPVIHITGTNGKTSTARITETLLRGFGLRTGLLTSPHLERINERIVLDGEPIDDERLAEAWAELQPILELVDAELTANSAAPVTFFEALTALAFVVFADAPVDVQVLEVGMGGTWDATNVADANVAVFTPIDLDHQAALGETTAEIARTKAGIMKPGCIAILAQQSAEVSAVLEQRAAELGSKLIMVSRDAHLLSVQAAVGGQVFSANTPVASYQNLPLPLHGSYQAHNALLALLATEALLSDGAALNHQTVSDALLTVTSPGRFDRLNVQEPLFIDAAHNPHAARALVSLLRESFAGHQVAFLVASFDDKDTEGVFMTLGEVSDTFFVTSLPNDRARDAAELAALATAALPDAHVVAAEAVPLAVEALREWVQAADKRVGVITGSIALAGEVLAHARSENWGAK